jgi:hypothetical protein
MCLSNGMKHLNYPSHSTTRALTKKCLILTVKNKSYNILETIICIPFVFVFIFPIAAVDANNKLITVCIEGSNRKYEYFRNLSPILQRDKLNIHCWIKNFITHQWTPTRGHFIAFHFLHASLCRFSHYIIQNSILKIIYYLWNISHKKLSLCLNTAPCFQYITKHSNLYKEYGMGLLHWWCYFGLP